MVETTLHELGHIYYYMEYTNEEVPIILKGGANRAYHEAMGSLLGLAAMQKPFLVQMGLAEESTEIDEQQMLLKEALNYIVLIPWGAGVMPEFEYELYAKKLPKDQYNQKWWEMKRKCMGIVPPAERGRSIVMQHQKHISTMMQHSIMITRYLMFYYFSFMTTLQKSC